MKYELINHNFENEVQTVTQLFQANDDYIAKTEITENTAKAWIVKNGITIAEHALPLNALPFYLSPRRVLMLALYHALQQAIGAYTPWGALTGIRPSKMVREWLATGWDEAKVIATMQDPFCCTEEKAKLALTIAYAENYLTKKIFASNRNPGRMGEQSAVRRTTSPVGIYVSIPFCPTRCVYCSFNVDHKPTIKNIHEKYVDALIAELGQKATQLKQMNGTVSSIYIGGGTPTVLPEYLLEKLLNAVAENFETSVEYSVEAGRPDTLTKEKLAILHRYGVNRIAVNPQTLNDKTLALIGRKHTADDFFRAFSLAREAGFNCINSDIIVGLPGETVDDVRRTMEGLTKLSPENITVHTLAVKRASHINANKDLFVLPNAQTTEQMLNIASDTCHTAGLNPYYLYRQKNMVGMFENVGYSKLDYECLYNVGMMAETQTVLGIGAGAVSKFVEGDKISREFNVKNPEIYTERSNLT